MVLFIANQMEVRYVAEIELSAAIKLIYKEAQETKQNINIVPQFVGANPVSCAFDKPQIPYRTIIIRPPSSD